METTLRTFSVLVDDEPGKLARDDEGNYLVWAAASGSGWKFG